MFNDPLNYITNIEAARDKYVKYFGDKMYFLECVFWGNIGPDGDDVVCKDNVHAIPLSPNMLQVYCTMLASWHLCKKYLGGEWLLDVDLHLMSEFSGVDNELFHDTVRLFSEEGFYHRSWRIADDVEGGSRIRWYNFKEPALSIEELNYCVSRLINVPPCWEYSYYTKKVRGWVAITQKQYYDLLEGGTLYEEGVWL